MEGGKSELKETETQGPKQPDAETETEATAFLKIAHLFKLGMLMTEQPHPATVNLSQLAMTELSKAINILREIDLELLRVLKSRFEAVDVQHFYGQVRDTLQSNGRIFLCGCGATGRLSLAIETLWRQLCPAHLHPDWKEKIVGFMAGGEVALIKAVEDFEDHPDFAPQQLIDLKFTDSDLLVASTESGVTPWVLGAAQYVASRYAEGRGRKPFFVYCNPDQVLLDYVVRTKEVLMDPRIDKLNLCVGPMAITGSTRMQASTAVEYVLGLCILVAIQSLIPSEGVAHTAGFDFAGHVSHLTDWLTTAPIVPALMPLIEAESAIYLEGNYLYYETSADYAITVLTDTTERSPTFSLYPFENQLDPAEVKAKCHSFCHLLLLSPSDLSAEPLSIADAWKVLLAGRDVRPLVGPFWSRYKEKVSTERIFGHILTRDIVPLRSAYCRPKAQHFVLRLQKLSHNLHLTLYRLEGTSSSLNPESSAILFHSTLSLEALQGDRLAAAVL